MLIDGVIYMDLKNFFIIYLLLYPLQLPEAIEGEMSKTSVLPQKCYAGGKITQVVTCAEGMSPQQDSCWSWVVCFAGVISNIVICGFTFSYGILFPALLDEFQQGKANTGEQQQQLLFLCNN